MKLNAESLQVLPAGAAPCKICDGPSPLFGVVDLNKSCVEVKGFGLALAGAPVYYRRCNVCGFAFTTAFEDWSRQDLVSHIYNEQYLTVDPDFEEVRPAGNAALIAEAFGGSRGAMRILDYGGGNGVLARRL